MLLFLILSTFAATLSSPVFDQGQGRTFESILERINEQSSLQNEKKPFHDGHDRLTKLFINEARQKEDGDMLQRDAVKKQVGDRRLKCVLYDAEKKKCLRHKISFLWGRR